MARAAQAWTAYIWTAVILQSIRALTILRPELKSNTTIDCECPNSKCQAVFWHWQPQHRQSELHYLFYYNIVDTVVYQSSVDKNKYKGSKKSGMRPTFSLKISNVQTSEAGRYFCQIVNPGTGEIPTVQGIELRPGEAPPTPPPPPPPKRTPKPCRCRNRVINKTPRGCGRLVLWPLVGVLASLAVVLMATLFYFSRLPKKCRHRFVKGNQLH